MAESLHKILIKAVKFVVFSFLALLAGLYAAIAHLGKPAKNKSQLK